MTFAVRRFAPALAALVLTASTPALAAPPDPDPWFGRDKALHFGVSAAVAGTGYGLTALATPDIRIRIAFGAGAGIVVGAAKELIDLTGVGDPSWKDFAWDVIGTVVGVGIAVSIDLAVHALSAKQPAAVH